MIYTVTLNPALDKTVEIPHFALDAVNRIASVRTDPGGKGINVSKVIAKLGGRSRAVGVVAGGAGRALAAQLEALGLDTLLADAGEGETRTNLKVIDPAGHTNTDINEPGPAVAAKVLESLLERLTGSVRAGDIVVLAGSLPVGAPQDTYRTWTAACRQAGAKVFLDADGAPLAAGIEARPYLVKPNEHELARLRRRAAPRCRRRASGGRGGKSGGVPGQPGRAVRHQNTGHPGRRPAGQGGQHGGGRGQRGGRAGLGRRTGLVPGGGCGPLDGHRRSQRHVQRHPGGRR